jgi:hypothetical protein
MRQYPTLLGVSLIALAALGLYARPAAAICTSAMSLVTLPEVPEASNLAASRRNPGLFWTTNDSGAPVVFALDTHGAVKGRVRLEGATVKNWEALAVGPCGSRSCLYIGDIGDNGAKRPSITIYRVPEPRPGDTTATVLDAFTGTYPDGPHDAEALFVSDQGAAYVITKEGAKETTMFRFPLEHADAPAMLVPVIAIPVHHPTDASVSPDGRWVAVRTNEGLAFYRADELTPRYTPAPLRVPLTELHEPRGEGVAFGTDGMVFLTGEGAVKGEPGTFTALKCELPS